MTKVPSLTTLNLLEKHLVDLGRFLDRDALLEGVGVDVSLLTWAVAKQGRALRG